MSIVKINAISVPEGAGEELEKRFAARQNAVDSAPGFEGFQLLRPVSGEDRYFVVTQWANEDSYNAWRDAEKAKGVMAREPTAQIRSLSLPALPCWSSK